MDKKNEFESFLIDLQPEMLRYGGGLKDFVSSHDLEDAVQDAITDLLEVISSDGIRISLKALAHLIVRRKICCQISWHQRQKRLLEAYGWHREFFFEGPSDPAKATEDSEMADRLWQAFQQLDDLDRITVGLRFWGGYSYSAIEEELGFDDRDAVNTCLRRARRHLHGILNDGSVQTYQAY